VVCDDPRAVEKTATVRNVARAVLRAARKDHLAVVIFLLTSARMRQINRRWHGVDRATNVLSFCETLDFINPPSAQKMLGEIYLCPSYIAAHGHDLSFLVIHGMLHLLGYDHVGRRDSAIMERAERRMCRAIGVAWPYQEQ
jgi:probable rRNA maturation factor